MLLKFLLNNLEKEEYETFVANPNNPIHIVKKIVTAVCNSPARTVNVLIRKDGTDFEFKTNADIFCHDCTFTYNSMKIVASDRWLFEAAFDRDANYAPQEIVRITYGKKTLYQA